MFTLEDVSMKNITLADIAAKTGYSINTVSHALHDKPDISKKTKEYIMKVADEVGYIANSSAGALRSGKTKNIAIILGDISNPYFSIMIKEMENTLRKYDYSAFIINTDENQEFEKKAIISAISRGVDGIIICPVQKSTENIDFLNEKKIPYVLIGRRFDENSNYVVCDDENGGKIAALRMFSENKHDILFLNGPTYISSARERLQGIKNAYKDAKISESKLSIVEIDITNPKKTIEKSLEKHSHCNGIICFSDLIAMQVCHCLKSMHIRVPEEVSVIGFDDISSQFYFATMLSSVTSSKRKTASTAVEILMSIISGENNSPKNIILNTKLILRKTTEK